MRKFITDIKASTVPRELETLYHKIKIEKIATGRPMETLITIPVFRRLFSIADIIRLITHYRHKTTEKQLTIF